MVLYRDYVGRGNPFSSRRKRTNCKKIYTFSGKLKLKIMVAVIIIIVFISSLYLITCNKSEEVVIVPNYSKQLKNSLPKKPKERWRYIKELENRQISVQTLIKPLISKTVPISA